MTVQVWAPYCTATLNGTAIDTQLLRGARVECSFADPVSKGYIHLIGDAGAGQGDDVSITLGGGSNNTTRFINGTIFQDDRTNTGPNWDITARGPLFAAQKFRNNRPAGRTLWDLTGGPATDEAIARAVLTIAGVSYDSGNIGGTGITRGSSAPDGYTWKKGETALDYLARLTAASIGYKMVESIGGVPGTNVYRAQILGDPGSSDFMLTEGVDIFDGAHVSISTSETFTAWEVTGFDYGDGLHHVYNRYPDPIPDGATEYTLSSDMIERGPDSDTRSGISCETVLGYIRDLSDGPITKISGIVTPRDDTIGPGQVAFIDAPNTLGISGNYIVTAVVCEATEDWFTQTLELVG